jgi:hypothetical protein
MAQVMQGQYDEIRLHIIGVTPTRILYRQSLKEFAKAAMLPRHRLAAHARSVVDAAICAAYNHYRTFGQEIKIHEGAKSAFGQHVTVEEEQRDLRDTFEEEIEQMDVSNSVMDVEVCGSTNEGEVVVVPEEGELRSGKREKSNKTPGNLSTHIRVTASETVKMGEIWNSGNRSRSSGGCSLTRCRTDR